MPIPSTSTALRRSVPFPHRKTTSDTRVYLWFYSIPLLHLLPLHPSLCASQTAVCVFSTLVEHAWIPINGGTCQAMSAHRQTAAAVFETLFRSGKT